jgi:Zn-dependent protease
VDATSAQATPPIPEQPPPLDPRLEEALRELRAPRRTSWIPLFALSALAFLLVQRGAASLRQALIVAAVVLVHELGHVVAMRVLGYRDVKVFFLPFFGALTSARAGPAARWKQAVVSLAGPVPGILLALDVFLTPLRELPLLREAAWLSLVVNAFNLLPLGFLDGGRLLDGLLFQRHRVLEALFAALSGLAFLGLAFAFTDWVLGVVGLFSLVGVPFAFRRATVAARLRGRLQGGDVLGLPRNEVELLHSAAAELAGPQVKPRVRADLMRQLHERATTPPAGAATTAGFTAAWLLSFVLAAAVAVAGVYRARPGPPQSEAPADATAPQPLDRTE